MKGIVSMYNKDSVLIESTSIANLKYKEEEIINKSIEMFNDDDPCIIHMTHCRNSLAFELIEKLNKYNIEIENYATKIEDLPEYLKEVVEFEEDCIYVVIR